MFNSRSSPSSVPGTCSPALPEGPPPAELIGSRVRPLLPQLEVALYREANGLTYGVC